MPTNDGQRLAQIIKESMDNVDIASKFKSSEPCIMKGHESLISNEISYDQAVNDAIHDFIENLTEFGMAAHYVDITSRGIHIRPINPNAMHAVMPAVIGGLKHDIVIVDDKYQPKYIDTALEHEKPFPIAGNPYSKKKHVTAEPLALIEKIKIPMLKQPKENHPYGWYRKFEKKRF